VSCIAKIPPTRGEHLAAAAPEGVAYNPTSGDIHASGYMVPTQPAPSRVMNGPPTPEDVHDFMMRTRTPSTRTRTPVLHAHSDDKGNHFLHVAHLTPDFGAASDVVPSTAYPASRICLPARSTRLSHAARLRSIPVANPGLGPDRTLPRWTGRTQTPWTPGSRRLQIRSGTRFLGFIMIPRTVIRRC